MFIQAILSLWANQWDYFQTSRQNQAETETEHEIESLKCLEGPYLARLKKCLLRVASGTAPSPLYFINSNRHSCPAVIFPECPTAVLSSGLQLDGAFHGCFYNVGGMLHFSRIHETGTFHSQFCSEKSPKLQQGISDKTYNLAQKA